jgi:uncharacterized membrane protein
VERARTATIGALFGLGAGGLLTPRWPEGEWVFLAAGAVLGGLLALARPRLPALDHPAAAAVAAVAGLLMSRLPEPTFFLLVPLVAAAVAWPFGEEAEEDGTLPHWVPPATFLAAAAVFFLEAANRHWQFGSGGKDLGLFTQQHWLLAHGLVPFNTVMGMHMLADHMTFIDLLVAPLLHLHEGPETLLLVQALGVASAAFPLYALGRRFLGGTRSALALSGCWLLSPEVHMGVIFDYNQTPIGSALLLWTAWALMCRGPVAVVTTALLACACKTDFPLYVAALALGLVLLRVVRWPRGVAVALLALSLFTVEIGVISPMFREGGFRHWEFEDLGETPSQIALTGLAHPDRAVALLVDQPEKRRALLLPLLTTGYVGLAEPLSLLLQLPNWGERFLSTHRTRWWGYYYGMPAAATATLGLLLGWRRLRAAGRASHRLPVYALLCALLAGLVPPYRTPEGNQRSDLYVWRQPSASSPEDVQTQRAAVAFIGRDPRLKVAAQYHLLPHLATRPFIVNLDRAPEADLVALQLNGGTHPGGRGLFKRQVRDAWATGAFHVAFCEGQSIVLRRGAGASASCPAWDAFLPQLQRLPPEE